MAAGGHIVHFGMPVDPGNLTLLACIDDTAVLGLPGSARSARVQGGDLILHRLLAGIPVTGPDIMRMGAGGLLKEIPGRPQPRDRPAEDARRQPRVAAIVLAAGMSRRMGARNKLLESLFGAPLVVRVVDAAIASSARPIVVVTGHEAAAVREALGGIDVTLVDNSRYAEGLSTSLAAGLRALPPVDGALICLGDMPRITAQHLDQLTRAFIEHDGRAICVPVFDGKRGNPVLWPAAYFGELGALTGDSGARHLLAEHAAEVWEVTMADAAIHEDIDTPEALAAARAATGER
ncbi:MAG: hypothetical protein FJX56_03240 [Alphaproteobacteria bacterium]|nr:hypothetical protein [Alphaproteobacteria bacterium]